MNGYNNSNIPMRRIVSTDEWINIFRSFDTDQDDKIPIVEFLRKLQELRSTSNENIPLLTISQALNEADLNEDEFISLDEFLNLVQKSEQGKSQYGSILTRYIKSTIAPRQLKKNVTPVNITETDGEYEDEYKFWPPPLGMILISIIEIITFLVDVFVVGYDRLDGPVAQALEYAPRRRIEAWRFLTYMFVHSGCMHLLVNLAIQVMLGLPLEMVHGWWRVQIVYIAGVIGGSLGTSVTDSQVSLVGASGGVYALITAHLATIIMNWSEMELAIGELVVFSILIVVDTGTAIYYRYVLDIDQKIGYMAHFSGALVGLLVGIYVLRNLEVRSWEKKLCIIALTIYVLLMGTCIIIHIAMPWHFPPLAKDLK